MKKINLLILLFALAFAGFYACSDDDDDPPVVTYEMVISDRETGTFYALDTATGALEVLGYISYNGNPLINIRGLVYDSASEMIYVSENSSGGGGSRLAAPIDDVNGRIFSVDPLTLEATLINDNDDDDWYALPGLEMYNGRILGTVYWDYYDYNHWSGLVLLNTDGTFYQEITLMYEGSEYGFYDGMAIAYGSNANEVLISYNDDNLIRTNINGNVVEIIGLNYSPGFQEEDHIKNLEWGNDGVLYAVTRSGDLGHINPDTGDFTFIAHLSMMGVNDGHWQGLTLIPEFVFEDFGPF